MVVVVVAVVVVVVVVMVVVVGPKELNQKVCFCRLAK